MQGLESYIMKVENFSTLPSSKKIDFFVYFLLINEKIDGVSAKSVETCFDTLHLEPYSNIPAYLSKNSKGKQKKFLKKATLYFLERNYKLELDTQFGKVPIPKTQDSSYLPFEIFNETRGYVQKIAEQSINCYDLGLFDACSVLTRKLVEVLIIECFERHSIEHLIKRTDGSFYFLSDLIIELMKEPKWNLGRNTKQALPQIKKSGDLSAHNRRYFARQYDVDKIKGDLRIVTEGLIHIIDYKNWK
jgi:hypothetical protein